jgi:hypothetical protein
MKSNILYEVMRSNLVEIFQNWRRTYFRLWGPKVSQEEICTKGITSLVINICLQYLYKTNILSNPTASVTYKQIWSSWIGYHIYWTHRSPFLWLQLPTALSLIHTICSSLYIQLFSRSRVFRQSFGIGFQRLTFPSLGNSLASLLFRLDLFQ